MNNMAGTFIHVADENSFNIIIDVEDIQYVRQTKNDNLIHVHLRRVKHAITVRISWEEFVNRLRNETRIKVNS